MSMFIQFHLLLLIATLLSVVTSTTAAAQSTAYLSSRSQEVLEGNELPEEVYGNALSSRLSMFSLEVPAEDTKEYATIAVKTKRQCRAEVIAKGYPGASEECRKKLKFERNLCQVQAEMKGIVFSDLCKALVDLKVCNEKRDCKDSAVEACCWVPGSAPTKQCVSEVIRSHPQYINARQYNQHPRDSMLSDIGVTFKLLKYVYKYKIGIMVLPVGQGDCIAMKCPNGDLVMFDCGSSNTQSALTAAEVKSVILDEVNRITIFISHGDVDHYKYLPTIFSDTSKVNRVIIGGKPDEYSESFAITQWMRTMANQDKLYAINECKKCIGDCNSKLHTIKYLSLSNTWSTSSSKMTTLDSMGICDSQGIRFDIIAANVGRTKNQRSIVLKVETVQYSVLFSGDMEGSAAKAVAKAMPVRLKSNVFQISHHGAGTDANRLDWLQAIRPEEAFVSHAFMGQYGHPRCDAIERLLSIGSIGTGTFVSSETHPFYCARRNKHNGYDRYSGETCHSVFSTYPLSNYICVIVFEVAKFSSTNYNCYKVQ